jgi:anti-sigma B factor antagonist
MSTQANDTRINRPNEVRMSQAEEFESQLVDGDILVIIPRGDLDSISSLAFESEVLTHLDAGHTKIIVDCRHLGHLSSLGIGTLVRFKTRLSRKGGDVKLAAVQGPVMNLLRLVRLDKLFDIHGDLEFARRAFQRGELHGDAALE